MNLDNILPKYKNFAETFQLYLDTFYMKDKNAKIELTEGMDASSIPDSYKIYLGVMLMDEFYKHSLPEFSVFYHELLHLIYTRPVQKLEDDWKQTNALASKYQWKSKYHHLINWIEDIYIEQEGMIKFPLIKDNIMCIRNLPIDDIDDIKHVFHYYYSKNKISPALTITDGITFKNYITKCLQHRGGKTFTQPITSWKPNLDSMQFIYTIIEFYEWCEDKGIFPKDTYIPSSPIPMIVTRTATQKEIKEAKCGNNPIDNYSSNNDNTTTQPNILYNDGTNMILELPDLESNKNKMSTPKGSTTEYTDKVVDVNKGLVYYIPNGKNDPLCYELYCKESQSDLDELSNCNVSSLEGMFNGIWNESSKMNRRVIPENTLMINKLINQSFYLDQEKCFNEVSIYRDVSGSTCGDTDKLMIDIIKYLLEYIPIEYNYYLYGSGKVSLLKAPFDDTLVGGAVPDYIKECPDFNIWAGTNSGAISNQILQELNDKHLNIVITDGDLSDLFSKKDLQILLDNIFVVFVGLNSTDMIKGYTSKMKDTQYILIDNEDQIENILRKLAAFGGL